LIRPDPDPTHWQRVRVLTDVALSGNGEPGHNVNVADGYFPEKEKVPIMTLLGNPLTVNCKMFDLESITGEKN